MTYLERVNSPDDLKKLTISELKEYAKDHEVIYGSGGVGNVQICNGKPA